MDPEAVPYPLAKNVTDKGISGALLVLLSPVFAVAYVGIGLDRVFAPRDRGPLLYRERRISRGREFDLFKFRTLRTAALERQRDEEAHARLLENDAENLTWAGRRILKPWYLDELPQLFNVLKGEMSLIGPRPHPVSNVPLFEMVMRNTPECGETIPYYALRSMVRPGLSGWAQVRYKYANDLEEEVEKMRYDLYYIKHMSAWLDLRILFGTLKIVLRGRESAYPASPLGQRTEAPGTRAAGLRLAGEGTSSTALAPPLVPATAAAFKAAPPPAARA